MPLPFSNILMGACWLGLEAKGAFTLSNNLRDSPTLAALPVAKYWARVTVGFKWDF